MIRLAQRAVGRAESEDGTVTACLVRPLGASDGEDAVAFSGLDASEVPRCPRCHAYANPFISRHSSGDAWRCPLCCTEVAVQGKDVRARWAAPQPAHELRFAHIEYAHVGRGASAVGQPRSGRDSDGATQLPWPIYIAVVDVTAKAAPHLTHVREAVAASVTSLADGFRFGLVTCAEAGMFSVCSVGRDPLQSPAEPASLLAQRGGKPLFPALAGTRAAVASMLARSLQARASPADDGCSLFEAMSWLTDSLQGAGDGDPAQGRIPVRAAIYLASCPGGHIVPLRDRQTADAKRHGSVASVPASQQYPVGLPDKNGGGLVDASVVDIGAGLADGVAGPLGNLETSRLFSPASAAYRELALSCARRGVCCDLATVGPGNCDLASLKFLATFTGGHVARYPTSSSMQAMKRVVSRRLREPLLFHCVLRLRCPAGLETAELYGHMRADQKTGLARAPGWQPGHCVIYGIQAERPSLLRQLWDYVMSTGDGVPGDPASRPVFQAAFAYSTVERGGDGTSAFVRRLRVHTIRAEWSKRPSHAHASADPSVLLPLICHQCVRRAHDESLAAAARLLCRLTDDFVASQRDRTDAKRAMAAIVPLVAGSMLRRSLFTNASCSPDERIVQEWEHTSLDPPSLIARYLPSVRAWEGARRWGRATAAWTGGAVQLEASPDAKLVDFGDVAFVYHPRCRSQAPEGATAAPVSTELLRAAAELEPAGPLVVVDGWSMAALSLRLRDGEETAIQRIPTDTEEPWEALLARWMSVLQQDDPTVRRA